MAVVIEQFTDPQSQITVTHEYDIYLRGFRGLADSTRDRHKRWLQRWMLYLAERNEELLRPSIESTAEFLESMRVQYSVTSQWQATSALRSFYEWAWAKGIVGGNPFRMVRRQVPPKRARAILSEEQVQAMLRSFDLTDVHDVRDHAILHYMYASLCRPGEACALQLNQLDLKAGAVKRYSKKTKKEQWIPIYPDCVDAIRRWLDLGRPYYDEAGRNPFVFIGQPGRGPTKRNGHRLGMTTETLRQIIRRAALNAGIDQHLSPYDIRHTAATHLLENGADIRYVQEMLGHDDIRTTQIYTHVRPVALRKNYEQFHPGAKGDCRGETLEPDHPIRSHVDLRNDDTDTWDDAADSWIM